MTDAVVRLHDRFQATNTRRPSFLIYTPTVDGVQEVRVETSSLGAEFGRFNGGEIDLVMKSGSNAVHGSVYEFIRNSAAEANYYFNKDKYSFGSSTV